VMRHQRCLSAIKSRNLCTACAIGLGSSRLSAGRLHARMNGRTSRSKTSIVTHRTPFRHRARERAMRMTAGDGAFAVLVSVHNSAKIREPEIRWVSGIQPDPTATAQPSPAASRIRRSRERRRRGEAIVSLEIGPAVITDLVTLGSLAEPDQADKGDRPGGP